MFYFVFFSVKNFAPDSITTWEVQAISISPEKGISIGYFLFVCFFVWIKREGVSFKTEISYVDRIKESVLKKHKVI